MSQPINPGQRHAVGAHPRADESIIGFAFRLGHLRRLRSPRRLFSERGLNTFTNRPQREFVEALAASARIPASEVEAISYGRPHEAVGRFRGCELPLHLFQARRCRPRRCCPACLAETAYHRAAWDLICVSACPLHMRELVDTCAACGQPLAWKGCDLTRCICWNGSLIHAASPSISEREARGTEVVLGLLGEARFRAEAERAMTLPPFSDLPAGGVLDFMFRLGMDLVDPRPALLSTNHCGRRTDRAHLALTSALEVAEAWPLPFFAALDDMAGRPPSPANASPFRGVLAVERWLSLLPEGSGGAIRSAAGTYRSKVQASIHRHRIRRRDLGAERSLQDDDE